MTSPYLESTPVLSLAERRAELRYRIEVLRLQKGAAVALGQTRAAVGLQGEINGLRAQLASISEE